MSPTLSVPFCTSTVATTPRPTSLRASSTAPWAGDLGIRLEVEHVGGEQDHLEQLLDALPLERRHRHHDRLAAPVLGQQAAVGELLLDPVLVGVRLVDLVDRDHDRHAGRPGVVDRLDGLRHDAVVGRHHQDHDVGHPGAAGAHHGERLVARRVEEDDLAAVDFDLVGADVLGDAAELALGDLRRADGVEERGLAVVDVAHDGDHRRARRRGPPEKDGSASASRLSCISSSKVTTMVSTPSSSASFCASSGSSTWLMLARMPRSKSSLIRSRARTPSLSANSRSVMPSLMVIGPLGAALRNASTLPSSASALLDAAAAAGAGFGAVRLFRGLDLLHRADVGAQIGVVGLGGRSDLLLDALLLALAFPLDALPRSSPEGPSDGAREWCPAGD